MKSEAPTPTATDADREDAAHLRPGEAKALKRGWTTGACAAAAAAAAWRALQTGTFEDTVTIRLPGGQTPTFRLETQILGTDFATAGIVKDAGDDPDVTHGLEIVVDVQKTRSGAGVSFSAGEGVGTVTLKGLPLAVGEPAINPGPRAQIIDAMARAHRALNLDGTVNARVAVSIPGGREVAKQTMNPRLGIEGGLSVLGTTGVVVPYSCASWIHAIHRGVDVARAQGINHVLAATGRTSEAAAKAELRLDDTAIVDMGDFVGGLLKYLRSNPVDHLTLAGGFAKIAKLAQGATDLHSKRSRVDVDHLADLMARLGGDRDQVAQARMAHTAARVLELAGDIGPDLAHIVARQAREVALATLAGGTDVQVWIYDRQGNPLAKS